MLVGKVESTNEICDLKFLFYFILFYFILFYFIFHFHLFYSVSEAVTGTVLMK
jgi:hypothetical protein